MGSAAELSWLLTAPPAYWTAPLLHDRLTTTRSPLYHRQFCSPNPPAPATTATMSAPHGAAFVLKRPWLLKIVKPIADWYVKAAGYRQLGLRYRALGRRGVPILRARNHGLT